MSFSRDPFLWVMKVRPGERKSKDESWRRRRASARCGGEKNAPSLVLVSYWATDTATHTWLESGLERFGPSGCEVSGSPGQSLRVRGDVGLVWSGMTVLTGHRCLLSGEESCFPPAEIVAMHVASQTSEVWRPVSATSGPVGNNSYLGERKRWAAVGYFVLFWPLLDSPWNCKIKI